MSIGNTGFLPLISQTSVDSTSTMQTNASQSVFDNSYQNYLPPSQQTVQADLNLVMQFMTQVQTFFTAMMGYLQQQNPQQSGNNFVIDGNSNAVSANNTTNLGGQALDPYNNIVVNGNSNAVTANNAINADGQTIDASTYNNVVISGNNNTVIINGQAVPIEAIATEEKAAAKPSIFANKEASLIEDPHIKGANGEKYEFKENGVYNVLNDKNMNINANLKDSYVREAGVRVGEDQLYFNADNRVLLNNEAVSFNGQPVNLANGGTLAKNKCEYTINGGENSEYNTTIKDKGSYLDLYVNSTDQGVQSDMSQPAGILGETFQEDKGKEGLNNALNTYSRNSLFAAPQGYTAVV